MPAQRSRTLNWRMCLSQLLERNGSLEITIERPQPSVDDRSLIWRVRLLALPEDAIVVEQPIAIGQAIPLTDGVQLVAIIAIGQNRWVFRTRKLGSLLFGSRDRRTVPAMRLAIPDSVERCQRRDHYRIETAALKLPDVDIWPLLDPRSVLPAERANELRFTTDDQSEPSSRPIAALSGTGASPVPITEELMLPEVGPRFGGHLMNIGGGGLGLRVVSTDSSPLHHHKLFWLRFALPPELRTPVCVTSKLVHTHLDSGQNTYAGMAFDFTFNPGHQRFVLDQICRYIALQQRAQTEHAEPIRRTA